jgi:hypothetical protein
LRHPRHLQILDTNYRVALAGIGRDLMQVIASSVANANVDTSNSLCLFLPIVAVLDLAALTAMRDREGLFMATETVKR